ncbi:MAG: DsbA family protein [Firmicutes bacterium]|nr:DsbA family protein [Bacillota bacterium]
MGNGVVQALKQEFDIDDQWVSYEIHPETPAQGLDMAKRFPASSREAMMERLQEMGAPYGITFGNLKLLSNSRLALEASEFARDQGVFHAYHDALFHAYFSEGKDIGDLEVLLQLAVSVGLPRDSLAAALADHRFLSALEDGQEQGERHEVSGTPTFIIDGRYKVVGAQPIDAFRRILRKIEADSRA